MNDSKENSVNIYTDGACLGNPGKGGWGAILVYKDIEKEIFGGMSETTNNQMEMLAAIKALSCLKKASKVNLFTDSQYLRLGITQWLVKWKKNNWKTSNRGTVKNKTLWEQLDNLAQVHDVSWHWVKGHSGHPLNERADQLARKGAQEFS